MQNQAESKLALKNEDVLFLTSLLGGNPPVGIRDPFRGYLKEEIDKIIQEDIVPSLSERKIIKVIKGSGIQLTAEIEPLVLTCALRKVAFIATHTRIATEDQFTAIYYMSINGELVEQQQEKEGIVLIWREPDSIAADLRERFRFSAKDLNRETRAHLSMQDLRGAIELGRSDGLKALKRYLSKAGCEKRSAELLAGSLANLKTNGSIQAIDYSSTPIAVDGIAFFEGETGIWQVAPDGQYGDGMVNINSCSKGDAQDRLDEWFKEHFTQHQAQGEKAKRLQEALDTYDIQSGSAIWL